MWLRLRAHAICSAGVRRRTTRFISTSRSWFTMSISRCCFTLLPDRSGGFCRLKDFYGHDRRIIEALEGESLRWIPDYDPGAHSQAPRGGNRAIDPLQQSLVFAFRAGGCPQALLFDLSQLAWG